MSPGSTRRSMPSTARGPFLNSRTRPSTSMPLFRVMRSDPSGSVEAVKYVLMLTLRGATFSRRGSLGPVLAHLRGGQAAADGGDDGARPVVPAVDGADAAGAG